MDFLSLLFFYLAPSLTPTLSFFSSLQSPGASISLITEFLHLNGRLCIVRTKGRAASEEVLDRGMDWAQRLGWVEVQVQASWAEQRQIKKGLHSDCCGTAVGCDWEQRTFSTWRLCKVGTSPLYHQCLTPHLKVVDSDLEQHPALKSG